MSKIKTYQYTTEEIKDQILEENRNLTRKLAETQQNFELLKFVHLDRTINLDMLNDIIVGCTGCLYSMMFYMDRVITNLDSQNDMYQLVIDNKPNLTSHETLFVSSEVIPDFTVVVYPVSVSQVISESQAIESIILLYPTRFVTPEILEFVQSFMLVADVLTNIVISREEMRRLIEIDPLTKLLNRSSWNTNLDRIIADGSPFFILSIDIDNFKSINDTYGHQKGDEVLITTGKWIEKSTRDVDKVFRLGGDEFAITGRVNSEFLDRFIHKLHTLNDSYSTEIKKIQDIHATISIGALISNKSRKKEVLYSRVDDLLYQSKQKGRNAISIISDFDSN